MDLLNHAVGYLSDYFSGVAFRIYIRPSRSLASLYINFLEFNRDG